MAVIMIVMSVSTGFSNVSAETTYPKETIYNGDGFQVKYIIDSAWNNEYIANVTITNTGDETIENWELSYQSYDEYTNIWNATVEYRVARYYNVKNAGHNQNIEPGQSINFGF